MPISRGSITNSKDCKVLCYAFIYNFRTCDLYGPRFLSSFLNEKWKQLLPHVILWSKLSIDWSRVLRHIGVMLTAQLLTEMFTLCSISGTYVSVFPVSASRVFTAVEYETGIRTCGSRFLAQLNPMSCSTYSNHRRGNTVRPRMFAYFHFEGWKHKISAIQ